MNNVADAPNFHEVQIIKMQNTKFKLDILFVIMPLNV